MAARAELAPQNVELQLLLANHLRAQGKLVEAEAAFKRATELRPGDAQARHSLSIVQLSLGLLEQGWKNYQARHELAQPARTPTAPLRTLGRRVATRTHHRAVRRARLRRLPAVHPLCIHPEGMGAARVSVLCPEPLATLLASAPGVDEARNSPFGHHDYWCYLLDVPMHLGTTLDSIPARLPYLSPRPQAVARWAGELPDGHPRVGLVWMGAAGHKNDANRSLASLASLAPLWSVPGVRFVSLQKGRGEDEARNPPPGQPLVELGSRFETFEDAAGAISGLDLVICVDTATAHLAGAMGKPVWVLVPAHRTDWRWLLEREDSPWYPGVMRLFRNEQGGDWSRVIGRMADELAAFVAQPRPATVPASAALDDLQSAVAAHAAGRIAQAEQICRDVLATQPDMAEALQMLGAIRAQEGASDEAESLLRRALAVHETPTVLRNLALLLQRAGRDVQAVPILHAGLNWSPQALTLGRTWFVP